MLRIISGKECPAEVVAVGKNNLFYCDGLVPNKIYGLASVDMIAQGKKRLRAKKDLVLVVQGVWQHPHNGVDQIFFMREDRTREGMKSLLFARAYLNDALKQILITAGMPRIECIGGFGLVPVYGDEIAIAESVHGPYGWIIKRDDVKRYLGGKSIVLKESSGELGQIRVWHETHIDAQGALYPLIRIEGWSAPPIPNDSTLRSVNEYVVFYDTKSRVVQRILLTNTFAEGIRCDQALENIVVGKSLPNNLEWR